MLNTKLYTQHVLHEIRLLHLRSTSFCNGNQNVPLKSKQSGICCF